MAKFHITYSFKCPKCQKANSEQTTVSANHKIEARDQAFNAAKCSQCGQQPLSTTPFTAGIKEI
jgi:transcription elongation factor Elf1